MTMILKKDFTSFNYRLFVLPAFTRAFFINGSPHGELSYNIKKEQPYLKRLLSTLSRIARKCI